MQPSNPSASHGRISRLDSRQPGLRLNFGTMTRKSLQTSCCFCRAESGKYELGALLEELPRLRRKPSALITKGRKQMQRSECPLKTPATELLLCHVKN